MSIAFGCISFQRPALFSLTLLSSSTIHKQMTRKRINFTFDPRLLLCKSCSCLRNSRENLRFDLPSETTAPRYSKLVTKPSFCPFALMPFVLFVISLFCSALICIFYLVRVLSYIPTRASSSCSSAARASMLSANHRFLIFLPPMQTSLVAGYRMPNNQRRQIKPHCKK